MDYITIIEKILVPFIAAGVIYIAAKQLIANKQRVLDTISKKVQDVESAVQGSGMGTKKKALVIAQLEAAGIKVNTWVSAAIDKIVAKLNTTDSWLLSTATEALVETVKTVVTNAVTTASTATSTTAVSSTTDTSAVVTPTVTTATVTADTTPTDTATTTATPVDTTPVVTATTITNTAAASPDVAPAPETNTFIPSGENVDVAP